MGCSNGRELPPTPPDFRYMCIFFYPPDRIKIVHATPSVETLLTETVTDGWALVEHIHHSSGVMTIKLSGHPFHLNASRSEVMASRQLGASILEVLFTAGWTLVTTSDLSQAGDAYIWFFRHSPSRRLNQHIMAVGIAGTDSLQLVNAQPGFADLLHELIETNYSSGIQKLDRCAEGVEFKLNGNPWYCSGLNKREGRLLILDIIKTFERHGADLYGTMNFRGTADTLYFMHGLQTTARVLHDFCMITLDRHDLIRLKTAPEELAAVMDLALRSFWSKSVERDICEAVGVVQWRLGGTPWHAEGGEAVSSRLLIANLLEVLHSAGWEVHATLDTARTMTDKTVFVLRTCQPQSMHYICISFNQTCILRVLNADDRTVNIVRDVIWQNYSYGLHDESMYFNSTQFRLKGNPWSVWPAESIHCRSFLCYLLAALETEGWILMSSADTSAKFHSGRFSHFKLDVHSWYLCRRIPDSQATYSTFFTTTKSI